MMLEWESDMDNRTIDIVSEGDEDLQAALKLIWRNAPGGKAKYYRVVNLRKEIRYYGEPETTHHFEDLKEHENGEQTLILYWYQPSESQKAEKLPFEMDLEDAYNFVKGWLKSADRGMEPDHDGSNHCGWRVFTESWGHVAGSHSAICGIQPAWAMYGK